MDSIDYFNIEVDIDDRRHLYDYASCRLLTREDGRRWDPCQFKGLGTKRSLPEHDDNALQRMHLMDAAIWETNRTEKLVRTGSVHKSKNDAEATSPEPEQPASCGQDLPLRVLPVYKPGELIRGKVELELKKRLKARYVKVKMKGYAFVNIRYYLKYGYTDIHSEEYYVKEKMVLWKKAKHGTDTADTTGLMDSSETVLPPGTHSFPFDFVIPESALQSTPPLIPTNANRAFIAYYMVAKIYMVHTLPFQDIVAQKGLWIATPFDIASVNSDQEKVTISKCLNTGVLGKAGKIGLRATLEKSGYMVGRSIPLTVELSNQSDSTIPKLEAYVQMSGRARLRCIHLLPAEPICLKGKKCSVAGIQAFTRETYHWNLPWDFLEHCVDGNLLPVGDLDDCSLINISYQVRVTVKRKNPHRPMKVIIPITVGNMDSATAANSCDGDQLVTRTFWSS